MSRAQTIVATAGTSSERRSGRASGGRMPWSSVRGLIVSGFAVLVIIFAAVTMGGVLQSARHQRELEQLEFHSNRAILIQNVETQAAVSGLLLQRYVDAGG